MKNWTAAALEALGCNEPSNWLTEAVNSRPIPPWSYDSVAERVVLAADLWLRADLEADVMLCEFSFDTWVKGIFDLVLVREGRTKVVDWKTTGDVKRPNYLDEVKSEFQSSFYLALGGDELVRTHNLPSPELIEYRCLDEKGQAVLGSRLRDATTERDALNQLASVRAAYYSQVDIHQSLPWARNRPRACFRGGVKGPVCPFYGDCTNMTMPSTETNPPVDFSLYEPRSKSALKDFLHCPEQYRRLRVLGERSRVTSSREILTGEAFHEAVHQLWSRAWKERRNLLAL